MQYTGSRIETNKRGETIYMEWNHAPGQTPANQPVNHTGTSHRKKSIGLLNIRTASTVLVFCIAVLLLAVAASFATGKGPASQSKYVDNSKMQAVFLNGGQVYFGKISSLNDRFMRLGEIYYLRVNQQVQPDGSTSNNNQDISLVKLGCELHGPQDSMVINQDQIIFWENLKDDGQVAKAVADYKTKNPDGQKCQTNQSTSNENTSNTSNSSNTSNTTNSNKTTTPTPTPSTNKKQ